MNSVAQRAVSGAGQTRAEVTASLDLFLDLGLGPVTLHAYLEGATTPFARGVSARWPEVNTDARTALDGEGRGRIQLSELKLILGGDVARATVGLLDATGYLDVSRIANDENLFFLGSPFVNNPTIEFPDYVPGVALELEDRGLRPGLKAVVSGSHGLAEVPGASYSEVVRLAAEGRGVFAGLTAGWERGALQTTLGGWVRTDPHVRLDGAPEEVPARGAWAVAGLTRGRNTVSLRLGVARPLATLPSRFVGVTWLLDVTPTVVGVGAGWLGASPAAEAEVADVLHAEAFLRFHLWRGIFLTGSAQALRNPGFAPDSPSPVLLGVRLSQTF